MLNRARNRRPATFQRVCIEGLECRTLLSVTVSDQYAGINFGQTQGYVPPDTNGAVGPSAYVETVNQTVRLFPNKTVGGTSVSSTLSNFYFTVGGLSHADGGSGLSDPTVVYDEHIGRFIVGDQDVNFSTHVSRFDLAVSKTSNPTTLTSSDWTFYSIVTTETGYDADYPGNMGYNADGLVFTLNMFGSAGHTQVVSVKGSDLASLAASPAVFRNDVADFSLRPTTMHTSVAGDPMWLVTEHGNGSSIDVIKMTNVLTNSATFTYTNLAVTPYSTVVNPRNPDNTVITNNIDSRIQKASLANNTLVAAHAVSISSTQDVIQWYKVNVGGATPALADQGRVSGGANTYLVFPAIDINASGYIGMTYMRSGTDSSTDYMSTWVTGRAPGDAAGTMQASVLSSAGAGQANYKDFTSGGREGDLAGISVDPSDGTFWAANEFANTQATANWGTAIVHFSLATAIPTTDMFVSSSGPSSVTAGTQATYTITLTNNGPAAAQGVILSDLLPTGATLVSFSKTTGADNFTFGQNGSTVTATAAADIASGSTDTFTVTVSAASNLANGAAFNNTASVAENNPDSNSANNTSTTTGSIVNTSVNADVGISVSGPSTANEGDTVTYTVTVTNRGPATATGVSLVDTLGSLLSYRSATLTQGSFSQASGKVTFTIGSMASGAVVTATITAQAVEDGSTSNSATVTTTSTDPTSGNNSASKTTVFAEPPISVSGSKTTRSRTLTNFATATFTHANGVEPVGNFIATINWGDGTTSTGTITKSGTTYTVTGSHTYTSGNKHTIKTTVVESGQSVDKFAEDEPSNWKTEDVVQVRGNGRIGLPAETVATGLGALGTLNDTKKA